MALLHYSTMYYVIGRPHFYANCTYFDAWAHCFIRSFCLLQSSFSRSAFAISEEESPKELLLYVPIHPKNNFSCFNLKISSDNRKCMLFPSVEKVTEALKLSPHSHHLCLGFMLTIFQETCNNLQKINNI